jgi:hypothetical protein
MSRVANVDVIEIKPTVNVYTALVAVAVLAELIALIALFTRASDIFVAGKGLLS